MKKIILIVLLSLSYLSYSQLDSISYYNGKGDLLNALRCSDKMNLSKSNSDYVELLTWKAELQYEIGNIKESEKYYRIIENGLDSLKNEFIGKEFYRHEIGVVYFDNNKLEEAEKNFSIHINEIKDNDNRVINSIEFIAEISKKNENYNKADSLYQKVIELRILKNGKDEMYSKTLTLYAQLKEKEKKYESAESLYNESIKINSTLQNNNYKPNVFKAMMFSDIKRYKEASYELNNVISHYDDNNNIKKDRFYWKAKIEQFSIILELSYYNECEIFIKNLNIEHIDDIKSKLELLDLYCIYYHSINNFEKLIHFVGLSSDIRVNNFDDNNPEMVKGFNNMAIILKNSGDLDKAIEYYKEAINIQLNNKLSNKKITATILKNLGDVYLELNDYENAMLCFNTSLKLFEKINDNYSSEFCNLINSFSFFFHENGLYENAIDLYKKNIIDSNLKNISRLNPVYTSTLMNYGIFLDSNLNSNLASDYFTNAINSFKSQNLEILDFLTNSEIDSYWLGNNYTDVIKSFLKQNSTKFIDFNISTYNYDLLLKNLTLRNQQRIKNSIAQSNNTELKDKYERFFANKKYLTKIEEQPLDNRPKDYETLKTDTENLEKDITRLSSTFADAKKCLIHQLETSSRKTKTK